MTRFATYPSLRDRVAFLYGGASGLDAEVSWRSSPPKARASPS
jgi:hypothetical protein